MTPKMKALLLGGFAATALAGGIGGAVASTAALAASPSPTPSAGSSSAPAMPAHGTPAHENAETAVTGANAAKAQAAAVKAVGGTAGAVTTDYNKTGYEVTVTKSDGTTTEVHLDSSFNVMQGGPGRPNGGNPPGA